MNTRNGIVSGFAALVLLASGPILGAGCAAQPESDPVEEEAEAEEIGTADDAIVSLIDPTCTAAGSTRELHNLGWPNHQNLTCASFPSGNVLSGLVLAVAVADCFLLTGQRTVKYFGLTCEDHESDGDPGGERTWTAYYGCCAN